MPLYTQRWSNKPLTKTADGYEAELVFDVTGIAPGPQAELQAQNAVPFNIGSSHPASALLRCDRISADTPRGPLLWEVRVGFRTGGTGSSSDNPIFKPMRYRARFGNISERVGRDRNGKPILSTSNTAFDGGDPIRFYPALFITAIRYEPFWDIQKSIAYRGKVNGDTLNFLGQGILEPGQLMCWDIAPAGEIQMDFSGAPVEIAYEFELRGGKKPFQHREVDRSTMGFYDANGTTSSGRFTDLQGNYLSEPILLNGNGGPIDAGAVKVEGQAAQSSLLYRGGGTIDPDQSSSNSKVLIFDIVEETEMGSIFE